MGIFWKTFDYDYAYDYDRADARPAPTFNSTKGSPMLTIIAAIIVFGLALCLLYFGLIAGKTGRPKAQCCEDISDNTPKSGNSTQGPCGSDNCSCKAIDKPGT